MHTISLWPGLSTIVETVINTPLRPEAAEACCDVDEVACEECGDPIYGCNTYAWPALCGACHTSIAQTPLADVCGEAPYDEPEIGSVERLYPEGRQAALSELDDVA